MIIFLVLSIASYRTNATTPTTKNIEFGIEDPNVISNVKLGDLTTVKDALNKKYVKVAFWGDSVTVGGDYIEISDTYVEIYMQALRDAFPEVTFVYQNFGISGRTLEQATVINYSSPDDFTATWATTDGKAWRDYVRDYNADLLFLAFGQNINSLGASTTSFGLETLYQYMLAGSGASPSLVLINNYLPKYEWTTDALYKERILSSRATRLYSEYRNLTMFDLYNRYKNIIDGVDERSLITNRYLNFNGFDSATPTRATLFELANFKVEFNFSLDDANALSIAWNNKNYTQITKTQCVLQLDAIQTVPLKLTSGNHSLKLEVIGRTINLYIDGALVRTTSGVYDGVLDGKVYIGYGVGSGIISNMIFTAYNYAKTPTKVTVEDLLGKYIPGNTDKRYPTGGNGVNHPSSLGFKYLYQPLINEFIKKLLDKHINVPFINSQIRSSQRLL